MEISHISEHLSLATNIVTIIGILFGLLMYFINSKTEKQQRELGTYDALDDKYIAWLHACKDDGGLDIYNLNEGLKSQQYSQNELILLENLICLMERAYLMYHSSPRRMNTRQWIGWNQFIEYWASTNKFKSAWINWLGEQFETNFTQYINDVIHSEKST